MKGAFILYIPTRCQAQTGADGLQGPADAEPNMAHPLQLSENIEHRSVIRYLWSQGKQPCNIHREITAAYGDAFMTRTNMANCCAKFAAGRTSVQDEARSGRPRTSWTEE